MLLIAGLWNPWSEYKSTRHNAGFLAIDYLQKSRNFPSFAYDKKHKLQFSRWQVLNAKVILTKPQTFMNLSGNPIKDIMTYFTISTTNLLVLHDELDYPLWNIKFKEKWWAAWHNGIKSIIEKIWTNEFWRIRIWIDRPPEKEQTISYVLSSFTKKEYTLLEEVFETVKEKAEDRIKTKNL